MNKLGFGLYVELCVWNISLLAFSAGVYPFLKEIPASSGFRISRKAGTSGKNSLLNMTWTVPGNHNPRKLGEEIHIWNNSTSFLTRKEK